MNLDYLDKIGTNESDILTDSLSDLSQQIADAIHASLVGKDNWYEFSQLAQSIRAIPIESTATGWRLQIEMNDYYEWIDEGRGATKGGGNGALKKSLEGMQGWIAHRGIPLQLNVTVKRKTKHGIKTYNRKLTKEQANKSLAFLISRKIHKHGYKAKGYHFLQDVMSGEILEDINIKLTKALGEWVSVQFD